jgi:tetratricopeptide (TPR) repeat protein
MVARLYIEPPEGRRKAGDAALKALSLDANLAEAHRAIGMIRVFFVPHDFPSADRELRRAIELSPNLATAHQFLGISLCEQGRLDDGLAELLKARDLDPLSPAIARSLATAYYLKRDSSRAIETLRNSFDLGPPFVISVEILIYWQSGHLDEALRILDQAKQERPDDPVLISSRGIVYAAQGRRAEALQAINGLSRLSELGIGFSFHSYIARIYSTLKERDLALEWLNRAVQAESITIFYKDDPVWEPIRDDKRFDELLRKMGIPVN